MDGSDSIIFTTISKMFKFSVLFKSIFNRMTLKSTKFLCLFSHETMLNETDCSICHFFFCWNNLFSYIVSNNGIYLLLLLLVSNAYLSVAGEHYDTLYSPELFYRSISVMHF